MSMPIAPETWEQMVIRIAKERGREITSEMAGILLWEFTAFPLAPKEMVIEQVNEFFESEGSG